MWKGGIARKLWGCDIFTQHKICIAPTNVTIMNDHNYCGDHSITLATLTNIGQIKFQACISTEERLQSSHILIKLA